MSVDTISLDSPVGREPAHSAPAVPPIVRIVLTQAAQHRMRGQITTEKFEAQIQRLSEEDLEPRGLELVVRDLACGSTRFIVKAKATGRVCDMIEIAPNGVRSEKPPARRTIPLRPAVDAAPSDNRTESHNRSGV